MYDFSLLLPQETIPFKRHNAQSTKDLVFSSSSLSYTLTYCCSRNDLDYRSEHFPMESSLVFSSHRASHVIKPLWKKADKVVLTQGSRELDFFLRNIENSKDIDAGVDRLVRWIKEAMAQYILFSKPVPFLSPGSLVSSPSL
jgi:hypothetical protein